MDLHMYYPQREISQFPGHLQCSISLIPLKNSRKIPAFTLAKLGLSFPICKMETRGSLLGDCESYLLQSLRQGRGSTGRLSLPQEPQGNDVTHFSKNSGRHYRVGMSGGNWTAGRTTMASSPPPLVPSLSSLHSRSFLSASPGFCCVVLPRKGQVKQQKVILRPSPTCFL